MEAIVLSATLVGSLGTAYVIQRALLGICIKAINNRATSAIPSADFSVATDAS
jgi:hypothetical protein